MNLSPGGPLDESAARMEAGAAASGACAIPSGALCERCGYGLTGLREGSECPECGRAWALNDPARRVGSPWQQRRLAGLIETCVMLVRRPGVLFETLRPCSGPAQTPLAWGLVLAVVPVWGLVLPRVALLAFEGAARGPGTSWAALIRGLASAGNAVVLTATLTLIGTVLLLLALTTIERWGLRLIAARRGWRVSRGAAQAIVGHAGLAWPVATGLGALTAWLGPSVLDEIGRACRGVGLDLGPGFGLTVQPWAFAALGFLVGMLWFETLVWIGLRRMRFANDPEAYSAARSPGA